MRDIKHKKKIIIFEELNIFNCLMAILYSSAGFDVIYFTVSENLKSSKYFSWFLHKYSCKEIDKMPIDFFEVIYSCNELTLKNVDLVYKLFCSRNRLEGITTALFESQFAQNIYKKIIQAELSYFYRVQLILNSFVKKDAEALGRVYFIPSKSSHLLRLFRSLPSFYIVDKKIKLPGYSYIINSHINLFKKITQLFTFFCWPFVLIKKIKKISFSNPLLKEFDTVIRIYGNGWNFNSEYRKIDFLLEEKGVTKDNTLFCIETDIDTEFRDGLIKRGYHFSDMQDILKELNWDFIKKVYFGKLLPAWARLCVTSLYKPLFITCRYRSILGLYLRWMVFLSKYKIKNYIVYNDFKFEHVIRNILLSKRGVKTWYYCHSSHAADLFIPVDSNRDIRFSGFAYLYYDYLVSWGKRLSSFYMKQENNIANFINLGCLWSEHVKRIMEEKRYSGKLKELFANHKQNGTNNRKIIGIFESSFGSFSPITFYDLISFFDGIFKLADKKEDFIFILKNKNTIDELEAQAPEIVPYYRELKKRSNFYFLQDEDDPSPVNAISDLTVSICFTSTTIEMIGAGKKAIYFDGASRFRRCYYDTFPNLVAHGYDELVRLVDYWLYEVKDEEFSNYIDRYIKNEIDPYADGCAITRFRKLLTKG